MTVDQFCPNSVENNNLALLQEDVFKSMLLKHAQPLVDNSSLPGIPSLLNRIRHQSSDQEVSTVSYVQILSERADSKKKKKTLTKVLGEPHTKFVEQYQKKWLIVVGDAKTYDLLQDIQTEHGSHLRWLIPFPGDWHLLYKKALMKQKH